MTRILHFTQGPQDWKALLAQPDLHWKVGRSAHSLATSWEAADGFPGEVTLALAAGTDVALKGLQPILAIPEFKVALPGGERPSQNDLFVLAKGEHGPVVIMVEGKVDEPFGPTIAEWEADSTPGKSIRKDFLLSRLGLSAVPASVRYQLLHRCVSALLVAEQYRARAAVMLVHSFSKLRAGWEDYRAFLALFGVEAEAGVPQRLVDGDCPLDVVWVQGNIG